MALKGHLIAGGLVGPLAGIESGSANDLAGFDESGNAGTRSLTDLLDAVIGDDQGTILKRGASAWEALAPADGYLNNASGALSWASVASPPVWKLIETRTVNGDEDFIGLASYQRVSIVLSNVAPSVSGLVAMRASINNGSSFMSASGDYYFISGLTGAKTNETEIAFHSSAGTSGVYGGITIEGFGLAAPNQITASNALGHFIATTSALNAIRIFGTNGALNSGTIYLLGLPGV